jgi:hypothetical protein
VAVSFIVGGNWEYPEKPTNLPQVTDQLYHIMLYTSNVYKGCNAMYGKKPVKFTHKTYIRTLG